MTETKQKTEPQPPTRFRKTVTGGSQATFVIGVIGVNS
jgi:hypothetical protein